MPPIHHRPRYTASRLDRYRGDLLRKHRDGQTITELVQWLRKDHRIRVAFTTVSRWLQQAEAHPLRHGFKEGQ
ncbi:MULTISPECIES: hypothetical protein [unclassified Aeromonas]|uniref:hypothetical protein n=1 Tax=unclassified Aeromonas TaxID=257493 RepID=UPI0022E5AD3C|nr:MULTISPECIES: hypothetical protein [unclassified Aeromonas]